MTHPSVLTATKCWFWARLRSSANGDDDDESIQLPLDGMCRRTTNRQRCLHFSGTAEKSMLNNAPIHLDVK